MTSSESNQLISVEQPPNTSQKKSNCSIPSEKQIPKPQEKGHGSPSRGEPQKQKKWQTIPGNPKTIPFDPRIKPVSYPKKPSGPSKAQPISLGSAIDMTKIATPETIQQTTDHTDSESLSSESSVEDDAELVSCEKKTKSESPKKAGGKKKKKRQTGKNKKKKKGTQATAPRVLENGISKQPCVTIPQISFEEYTKFTYLTEAHKKIIQYTRQKMRSGHASMRSFENVNGENESYVTLLTEYIITKTGGVSHFGDCNSLAIQLIEFFYGNNYTHTIKYFIDEIHGANLLFENNYKNNLYPLLFAIWYFDCGHTKKDAFLSRLSMTNKGLYTKMFEFRENPLASDLLMLKSILSGEQIMESVNFNYAPFFDPIIALNQADKNYTNYSIILLAVIVHNKQYRQVYDACHIFKDRIDMYIGQAYQAEKYCLIQSLLDDYNEAICHLPQDPPPLPFESLLSEKGQAFMTQALYHF